MPVVLAAADLDALVRALAGRGYRVLGPVARDGAIVIDDVRRATDLPIGLEDVQGPGRYRLERRDHDAFFAFTLGPHSWKETFHVPVERLFQIRRNKEGFSVIPDATPRQRVALLGARACEIHAIEIQDRILIHGEHPDPRYAARRSDVFVVAVNCMRAGNTCFCASMGTGPRAERGFDLALTELMEPGDHRFLVEIGSDEGAAVAAELPVRPADPEEKGAAVLVSERTAATMGRRLDTSGLKERLQKNLEHPRWDDVATRCLACGNCTMVCPTCFCTEFEDTTDLAGETAERTKRWESCFALAFSHVHGGSVRSSIKARYRQWLTHKLAGWHDQFGSSGCVGCGRCITWCPVGIDITEEAAAVGLPEKDG
ncbi:4Fe-4S dicluster domain-containing protein [Polyangium sp. rjm3]|uniref:4Fe-4S dicluster domain-containing protein n=1 Tax=Polyangium mundeleinium TaxID=2995306 RepID=A0ABT5ENC8_9BACT|nr:4Fe-4S dicluster domain-containing protein [Polyangium mundeleinium]MDC0742844.1 4Fe-4S dicluster domain-containing protein [Polyangium mundeleinium]